MKLYQYSLIIITFSSATGFAKVVKDQRKPNSDDISFGQVQLCEGTAAFGNEGQGMAVSAFINYSATKNYETNIIEKKCEIGFAFSFEYGNDRGFRLGKSVPYNMYPVTAGKTVCAVTEENGEVYLTLTKAARKNSKSNSQPKVLVDRCKLSAAGF